MRVGLLGAKAAPALLVSLSMLAGCSGVEAEPLPSLPVSKSWSATVADWDGDGWDDLLLIRHSFGVGPPDVMLRNKRGVYEVWWELPPNDRHDCTEIDANGDGRLDFYCSVGKNRTNRPKIHNQLWLQNEDGTFSEQARPWGVADDFGRGRYVTSIDLDGDGKDDLYTGNSPGGTASHVSINRGGVFSGPMEVEPHHADSECAVRNEQLLALCFRDSPGRVVTGLNLDVVTQGGEGKLRWIDAAKLGDGFAFLSRKSFEARGKTVALPRAGHRIATGDFNGDGETDIYVVASGCIDGVNRPDMLYLWKDADWLLALEPASETGCGNVAVAVDHDRDRKDAILLMEGSTDPKYPGEIRLLNFFQK